MSLTEPNLFDIIKKQYAFKLRAFMGVFISLAATQLIGMLFSIGGVSSYGTSTNNMSVTVTYFSADMTIIFTFMWAFISGIIITTKAPRYDDFTFVSNRLSSNAANILFLGTASIIGGAAAMLAGFLPRVIAYFVSEGTYGVGSSLFEAPIELLIGIVSIIFYIFMFSSLGYLIGMIVQMNKAFVFILPAVIVGILVWDGVSRDGKVLSAIHKIIFAESSLTVFVLKTLILAIVFLGTATALSNRMEVRV